MDIIRYQLATWNKPLTDDNRNVKDKLNSIYTSLCLYI